MKERLFQYVICRIPKEIEGQVVEAPSVLDHGFVFAATDDRARMLASVKIAKLVKDDDRLNEIEVLVRPF